MDLIKTAEDYLLYFLLAYAIFIFGVVIWGHIKLIKYQRHQRKMEAWDILSDKYKKPH